MMFTLTAPSAGQTTFCASSGKQYPVSTAGTITVAATDLADALAAGFTQEVSAPVSGGGRVVTAQSAGNINLNNSDNIVEVAVTSGATAGTITMPPSPTAYQTYTIIDAGTNFATHNQTLTPNSGQGAFIGNALLTGNGMSVDLYYDGTNWRIKGGNGILSNMGVLSPNNYSSAVSNNIWKMLPKWSAALAKANTGKGNARVLCIGDSTTFGYGANNASSGNAKVNSYPKYLSDLFNNAAGGSALWYSDWNGVFGSGSDTAHGSVQSILYDSRFTVGTGWLAGTSFGTLFGGGWMAVNLPSFGGGSGTLSFTPTDQVDTFIVWYLKSTTTPVGNFNVNVDGGSATVLSSSGSVALTKATISAGSLGTHTLNIVSNDTVNIWIMGIEAYNSAKSSVQVMNAGLPSALAADWNGTTGVGSGVGAPENTLVALTPNLTILDCTINDWNANSGAGTGVSTYTSQMQSIISNALTVGDLVLVTGNPSEVTGSFATLATQQLYVNACYALAESNNVPIVDIWSRWGAWPTSNSLGLNFDALHPVAQGYQDIASAIFNVIGGK